jgi:hypothetical protein
MEITRSESKRGDQLANVDPRLPSRGKRRDPLELSLVRGRSTILINGRRKSAVVPKGATNQFFRLRSTPSL